MKKQQSHLNVNIDQNKSLIDCKTHTRTPCYNSVEFSKPAGMMTIGRGRRTNQTERMKQQ